MQSTDSAKRRIKAGQVCQINNLYIPFTFASSLLTPSPNMLVLESDQPNHQTCFNTVSTTKMQWILVVDITISTTSGYHFFFIILDKKNVNKKWLYLSISTITQRAVKMMAVHTHSHPKNIAISHHTKHPCLLSKWTESVSAYVQQ